MRILFENGAGNPVITVAPSIIDAPEIYPPQLTTSATLTALICLFVTELNAESKETEIVCFPICSHDDPNQAVILS